VRSKTPSWCPCSQSFAERPGHRTFAIARRGRRRRWHRRHHTVKAMAIVPELRCLSSRIASAGQRARDPIDRRPRGYDICEKVHIPLVGVGCIGSGRERWSTSWREPAPFKSARRIISKGGGLRLDRDGMGLLLEEPGSPPSRRRSGSRMPKFRVVPLVEMCGRPARRRRIGSARFRGQPGQF